MPHDKQKLIEFSAEHLCYEINCLYATVGSVSGVKVTNAWENNVKNVLLEGITLHARVLYQFLYWDRTDNDDALAVHFFSDPNIWISNRPKPSENLKKLNKRVGKEIAHLTYSRMRIQLSDKGWNIYEIARELMQVLDVFVVNASPDRLSHKVTESINHWKQFSGYNNSNKRV